MFRKSRSLRNRLFLAFLGLALVPLVVAVWMAVATSAFSLREKIGTYSRQLVGQIAQNLDSEYRKVKGLTDEILISPEVAGRMVGYRAARTNDQAMTRFIFSKLIQRKFLNVDHVDDVILTFSPRSSRSPEDRIESSESDRWDPELLDRLAQTVAPTDGIRNLGLALADSPDGNGKVIVMVRPVRNALADATLGFLFVVLDPDFFGQVYRNVDVGTGADVFVVDRDGMVVSSRQAGRALGTMAIPPQWLLPDWSRAPFLRHWEGQEHLFATAALGTSGWVVVGAVPSSYLDSETVRIASQVMLFSLGVLLVALAVSLRIAEGFTAPLRNLERTMSLFGEGMMQARAVVVADDELGRLQSTFNAMADDITSLLSRIKEEHRMRRLSELRVLEYQINPHFLYNTLDSINWMARKAHQDEIGIMVTALAKFFRLSLSRGQETYRVHDEVDHVQAFVSISQMRYPDCFETTLDIPSDLEDRLTLKVVLQPLVENAIKHGIDKRATGGQIGISARPWAGGLEWQVSDNGKGMDEDHLNSLRQRLENESVDVSGPGGFGLVNVAARIRLNFGTAYGLTVRSQRGHGTVVTVRLPWIEESENSNEKQNL